MSNDKPREGGAPGTSDQWPRWEGPPENRPHGYLPAKDDPVHDRDAAGENLRDLRKRTLGDAGNAPEPRETDDPDGGPADTDDRPQRARPEWDDMTTRGAQPSPGRRAPDLNRGPDGSLPEEDDDNEYQESDEALPDDREERAIARDPDREGGRFDEI